jgi:hypothetical protein
MYSIRTLVLFGIAGTLASLAHAEEAAPPPPLLFYAEPSLKEDNAKAFGFNLEYGQNTSAGKSEYRSRNGKVGAKYENGLDEIRLDGTANNLETSKGVIDDKLRVYFGYDRYIGSRLWLFLLSDWESNKAAGLNYNQLTGGGVKVDILRNSAYKWNVGLAYLKRAKQTSYEMQLLDADNEPFTQEIKNTKDDQVVSARMKFSYSIEPTGFSLVSFYQPTLNREKDPLSGQDKADYTWSAEASLSHSLSKQIYVKLSYNYRYESLQSGPGSPRQEEKSAVLLGYEF